MNEGRDIYHSKSVSLWCRILRSILEQHNNMSTLTISINTLFLNVNMMLSIDDLHIQTTYKQPDVGCRILQNNTTASYIIAICLNCRHAAVVHIHYINNGDQ